MCCGLSGFDGETERGQKSFKHKELTPALSFFLFYFISK